MDAFFRRNCVKCHGAEKQKGKLRLDNLAWKPSESGNVDLWQAVVDRLKDGEMPPEDERQPSAGERSAVVKSLSGRIAAAAADSD